jgi:ribosome-dependent ATPase
MNEAERCDRISLMHAGKVLASDTPAGICQQRGKATLEEAFISYLEEATGAVKAISTVNPENEPKSKSAEAPLKTSAARPSAFSLRRLLGYAYRESLELRRDPIRLAFALLGSVLLMFVLGFGISLDVEGLRFAALDRDQSPESRAYIQNFAGSRFFIEQPPILDDADLDRRMKNGELALAIDIPANFGRDLRRSHWPEVGVWVDGAMPFRGETVRGYVQGLHLTYVQQLVLEATGVTTGYPVNIVSRYRYNLDFKSIYAMVPAVIPILLIFIPAILMALGVVREKELGSITNLYVTPVTRLEFLLGKQLPYIAVALVSYALLIVQSQLMFHVPIKGSLLALSLGAFLYVIATTGVGLLISTFTSTQIAALFGTAILTILPTVSFSGLTSPVAALEGISYWIGQFFPASYFLIICRGTFTKALGFADLLLQFLALACFIPVLTLLSVALLKKQEK